MEEDPLLSQLIKHNKIRVTCSSPNVMMAFKNSITIQFIHFQHLCATFMLISKQTHGYSNDDCFRKFSILYGSWNIYCSILIVNIDPTKGLRNGVYRPFTRQKM